MLHPARFEKTFQLPAFPGDCPQKPGETNTATTNEKTIPMTAALTLAMVRRCRGGGKEHESQTSVGSLDERSPRRGFVPFHSEPQRRICFWLEGRDSSFPLAPLCGREEGATPWPFRGGRLLSF